MAPSGNCLSLAPVLDPETQPCYAADMPDTDSRLLAASLNDLNMMSCLQVTSLADGAAAHRFTECCNELALAIGFCATLDAAETEFDRGRVQDSVIRLRGWSRCTGF